MTKINFEEFVLLFPSVYEFNKNCKIKHYGGEWEYPGPHYLQEKLKKPGLLYCKVQELGGVSGGSCWDHSDPQPYHCNDEFEFNVDFLFENGIDILFSKYLKVKKLYQNVEYSENEYYGNYTDYRIHYVYLEDLYEEIFGE
jgi:hypothetical protein